MSEWKSDKARSGGAKTGLLLATVGLFLVSAFIGAVFMMQQFRPDQAEVRGSGLWLATEVDRELLRLTSVIGRYARGDRDVTHDDVMLRFDILWSQVDNLRSGSLGQHVVSISEGEDAIDGVVSLLDNIEPALQQLAYRDLSAGQAIIDQIAVMIAPIHKMAQRVDKWEQEFIIEQTRSANRSFFLLALIIAATSVLGTVLLVFLFRENKRARDAESRVRQINQTLEQRVLNRTRDLEVAVQIADEANAAKSDFMASMNHELRTPLNAISGFAQMLVQETFGKHSDPHYLDYAKSIHDSSQHLIEIVGDVLDLSKIEAGQLEVKATKFSLHPVIEECSRLIGDGSRVHSNRVTTELADDTTTLFADLTLFRQIMLNLLSNADKYTPMDGLITVRTERGAGNEIIVRISDTGVGIEPEDLMMVLEPFGQARANSQVAHEGTGLGLPIAKSLIEAHGGRLELESQVGTGTTVTLVFPNE